MQNQESSRVLRGLMGLLCLVAPLAGVAQDGNPEDGAAVPNESRGPRMTAERLGELITRVDDEALHQGATWFFHIEGLETVVVYDVAADRMRIIIPIVASEELLAEDLQRVMQANFDSALDARYALGQGTLWGAFIHPLGTLTDEEFLVGIGQTVNVVLSYGSNYSSGLFIYGNGDSAEIERQRLIERLKKAQT